MQRCGEHDGASAGAMKWLWKEKSAEAVLEVLRDTRIGRISTRRVLREGRLGDEMAGSGDGGKEGGTGPPEYKISFLSSLWGTKGTALFFLCWAGQRRRGRGRPTMVGGSNLG